MSRAASDTTPWFNGQEHPAYIGPYRREFPAGPFSCWNGKAWYGDESSADAAAAAVQKSPHDTARWKGRAQPPEAPCLLCRGQGLVDNGAEGADGWPWVVECPEC